LRWAGIAWPKGVPKYCRLAAFFNLKHYKSMSKNRAQSGQKTPVIQPNSDNSQPIAKPIVIGAQSAVPLPPSKCPTCGRNVDNVIHFCPVSIDWLAANGL
jgi:hypothetical protein